MRERQGGSLTDAAWLEEEARRQGFSRVAFCPITRGPSIAAFDRFLAEGRDGDMAWMARGRDARAEPRLLLPEVRGAVVLGVEYGGPRPPDPGGLTGKVARYAWGRDYHKLLGKRLKLLCAAARARGIACYAGVDARPILERGWAEAAGLGFIGKNACIIAPGETSWVFLAVVYVSVPVPDPRPRATWLRHCGRCTRCLDACPTGAFTAPGEVDARRCVSYLTIELRGEVPEALRPGLGRWVFGCDDCQEVCPHNHRPSNPLEAAFWPVPGRAWLDLPWLLRTPAADIDAALAGSPLRRAKPEGLARNAAIVLGNLGDPAALGPLRDAADAHPSPLVRSHARWALGRLDATALSG
jgi:epoxyqueuosine reductase